MPAIQPQSNFHYPASGSSCQPPGQRAKAETLAPACIIHFGGGCGGGTGVGGEWVCPLLPPKLVLQIPGTGGHGGADSRDNRQGATLPDGAAGDRAAAVYGTQGLSDLHGTGPPAPTLAPSGLGGT